MHPIAVPAVLDVEDWLAEELPEVGQFDETIASKWVLCTVAGDHEWEFAGDDEIQRLDVSGP